MPPSPPSSPPRSRLRRWFPVLFASLSFAVFAYPPWRLTHWYGSETALGGIAVVGLWLVAMGALWYSFGGPRMVVRYVVVHWMGVSFMLMCITALYEGLRWVLPVDDRTAVPWLLAATAALVVGTVIASHLLWTKHLRVHSRKVTRAHRIVHVTDIHIGSRRGAYLTRIVRRINRLRPDVVVITGDLVDSSAVGHAELSGLRHLRSRALFTLGNHERYADVDKLLGILPTLGVETLRQAHAMAGELQIIGIDDADHHSHVAEQLPAIRGHPDHYTVLLYHRPLGWEAAVHHGVDLMLCGHTHNGQIFPFNFLVKRQFQRIRGLYRDGDAHLYVSPGTGTWGPLMRLGSLNEITCIEVTPTPR